MGNQYMGSYEETSGSKKGLIVGIIAGVTIVVIAIISLIITFNKIGDRILAKYTDGRVTGPTANILVVDENAKETAELDRNAAASEEVMEFVLAGLPDSTIDESTIVYLDNLNEDFYLKYKVFLQETGDVLYESDLIPPLSSIEWKPGELLKEGENILVFRETPFYKNENGEYTQVTTGDNVVTFTKIS